MSVFDFDMDIKEEEWLIKDMIPKGSIIGVVAQSTSGKSTLINALMLYVLNGKNFLDKETEACDVLLIDQDSQERGLYRRIKRISNVVGKPKKNRLFVKYMERKYFSDDSLYNCINEFPTAKLIIIDAFHKVGGNNFDFNSINSVARAFEQLKQKCMKDENNDRAIVVLHHVTEKTDKGFSAEDYMESEDFGKFAMGSSAFIESLDCYYVISTPDKGDLLKRIYVRPVSKRVMLPMKPFVVNVIQDENNMDITYKELWRKPEKEVDVDVMLFFEKTNKICSVKEVVEGMNKKHTEASIREALKRKAKSGKLHEIREAHNLFKYEMIKGEEN